MNVGKYEIVSVVGEGGMSTVYRCRDPLLGRDVAVKLLRATTDSDSLALTDRFFGEARITGRLQHPSIITLFDFGVSEDHHPYIVMEFVEGKSLNRHLGNLSAVQVAKTLQSVALGLDYAHGSGIVHRDIKPSNLLLTFSGESKILDFGIAMIAGNEGSRLTQTGIVVGTPDYLSPEQVAGGLITSASDQFSLAVVAFELLTGERPFIGETMTLTLTSILMRDPADASRLNATLSSASSRVLFRALSKKPSDRFPTCAAFVDALLSGLAENVDWQPFQQDQQQRKPDNGAAAQRLTRPATHSDTRTKIDVPITVGLSVVRGEAAPADFSFTQAVAVSGPFFGSGEAHFRQIKQKLDFYQEQLQREYETILQQMRTTYILWLVAVILAFVVLLTSVILFFLHQVTGGAISTVSTAMLYFLQRVFQQREDTYRQAAEAKRSTLEYGNQWALVIQTIQAMEDPRERAQREASLVQALTDHLSARKSVEPSRRKKARPAAG